MSIEWSKMDWAVPRPGGESYTTCLAGEIVITITRVEGAPWRYAVDEKSFTLLCRGGHSACEAKKRVLARLKVLCQSAIAEIEAQEEVQ